MKSLRDTIVARFGLTYEDREDMMRDLDKGNLKKLTAAIMMLRNSSERRQEELRAANDAAHIMLVQKKRAAEEKGRHQPPMAIGLGG